jgi:hypothetical protein
VALADPVRALLGTADSQTFEGAGVTLAEELVALEGVGRFLVEELVVQRPRALLSLFAFLGGLERLRPGAWRASLQARWQRLELPCAASLPAWSARYPAQLQPSHSAMQAATPRAQEIAGGLLGSIWPAPAALEVQIARLRERLLGGEPSRPEHLRSRLARLEERLESQRVIRAPDLHRAQRKLAARLALERSLRLQEELERLQAELLRELCGAAAPPLALPEGAAHAGLLSQVLGLPEPSRGLGLQLFRARLGPPPWDLRDDSRNRS